MPVVGPRLRSEREKRGLRLVDVAMETKVGAHHLSALEYGDFAALPDDRSVIRFVRVYAEHLGIDAEAAAADYARELEEGRPAGLAEAREGPGRDSRPGQERRPEDDAVPEEPAEPGHSARSEERPRPDDGAGTNSGRLPGLTRPWSGPGHLLVAAALVVVLVLLGSWWLSGEAEVQPPPDRPESGAGLPPESSGEGTTTGEGPRAAEESGETPISDSAPNGVRLIVREHGVGTGVVDRALVGEGNRFVEGEQVWFWTRVSGGAEGETIRHVWFHEGRETARIPLTLGGPHWRTQSRKILTIGMTGRWAVEAQDEAGRVIARSEFVCSSR